MQSRIDVFHFEMNFLNKNRFQVDNWTRPVFLGTKNMFERNSFEQEVTSLIAPLLLSVTISSSINCFSKPPKGGGFGILVCLGILSNSK